MNLLLAALLSLPMIQAPAPAQFGHIVIDVKPRLVGPDGGERDPTAIARVHTIKIGEVSRMLFWTTPGVCAFNAGGEAYPPEAIHGWQVAITPKKVEGDAVTFRVFWARGIDQRKPAHEHKADLDVTLRPGESVPLDLMRIGPSDLPCKVVAGTLTVSVSYKQPEQDRRLVATELWLVERLANGTERSQQVNLRGEYNRPQPFYFEDLSDGDIRLDLSGELVVHPRNGYVEVELSTHRRFHQVGPNGRTGPTLGSGTVKSTVAKLAPGDVAAIELPPVGDKRVPAFRDRAFTLRVRARQIRDMTTTTIDEAERHLARTRERVRVGVAVPQELIDAQHAVDALLGRPPTPVTEIKEAQAVLAMTAKPTMGKGDPVTVTGAVKLPGVYEYTKGMTVADAITLAGGLTERGSRRMIRVLREQDGKRVSIRVTEKDVLNAHDTVVVPTRIM